MTNSAHPAQNDTAKPAVTPAAPGSAPQQNQSTPKPANDKPSEQQK